MIKSKNCPICNSNDLAIFKKYVFKFPGNDVEDNLENIVYVRLWILFKKITNDQTTAVFNSILCNSCGLIFTNPRFSENELKLKYDTIDELGSVKHRIKNSPAIDAEKRANRIFNLIKSHYKPHSKRRSKILDFGGASGDNLVPFISNFQCNVIDYEKWDLPAGVEYRGRNLSDLKKGEQFDVILLLHTLEHIIQPKVLLNELCKYLSETGIIYVEVPLGCFKEWKYLDEPLTHINFFSEQSLFECFRLLKLNVLHLDTSFQRVTTSKKWCLNIIGTKKSSDHAVHFDKILSTEKQMSKISYYLPYIFKLKSIKRILNGMIGNKFEFK